MKADLSRGHLPDEKRGRKYRRVLLQQGRLLLDSDLAALVAAGDTLVRDLTRDTACASAGSPDLGFLVTPGPLIAVFGSLERVTATGAPFQAYRDYGRKYLARLPSLYIGATEAAGSVTIKSRLPLARSAHPVLRIWARLAPGVSLNVRFGTEPPATITGKDASNFCVYEVGVPASVTTYDRVVLGFGAKGPLNEVWIGLIEGRENAAQVPHFWAAAGRYALDGLAVELGADGRFAGFPLPGAADAKEFAYTSIAKDTRYVAYLEGWERHITHVEDPGILEQALGGILDTCTRTQAVGQVKLAPCNVPPDQIPAAFRAIGVSGGRLQLLVKQQAANKDPCAIPEAGGYTGGENRLYRFEVHNGGNLGVARLKWSRNNGADLFAVEVKANGSILALARGADVRDGDLIEVLAEAIDLGDQAMGSVEGATPAFKPPARSVGVLYYAREVPATPGHIELLDIVEQKPTKLDDALAALSGAKVRRWHGLLQSVPANPGNPTDNKFQLGDGIEVTLSGSGFSPGDYWQYEARKLQDNASGAWIDSPHGPERLFTPLALLRYENQDEPLELERWYDERFSPLCALTADDIDYDGSSSGVEAATVQEALDQLFAWGASRTVEAVEAVYFKRSGMHDQPLQRGGSITADQLASGLLLKGAANIRLQNATEADCGVIVEMPYPQTAPDVELWGAPNIGYQPITLAGAVEAKVQTLFWRPLAATGGWLRTRLYEQLGIPSVDFYSSKGDSPSKWSRGIQHQLVHDGFRPYVDKGLVHGERATGAAAVYRRPASGNKVFARFHFTQPINIGLAQAGIIHDWRGSADFSILLYEAKMVYGGGGAVGIYQGVGSSLSLWHVRDGVAKQETLVSVFQKSLPWSDYRHPPIQLLVSPEAVEVSGLPFQSSPPIRVESIRLRLAGQRIGVFTTAPVEIWDLNDGVQSLQPQIHNRVRARLALKRSGVTFTGAVASAAPFVPDHETWFWVTPSFPTPYGYGTLAQKPYGNGLRQEYPGVGAELIR